MIRTFPANSRYHANHGWLQSNFSFSFADYYDPSNMGFGPMRVLNDDIIQGGGGFDTHPHREMEIVSIVLEGQLEHRDSLGNVAVTSFGQIQRMSAGTGVFHSEFNPSQTEPMNLLQMWFHPETKGLAPSYETSSYNVGQMKNALLPVVSNNSGEGIAHIHQDMTVYLSDLDQGYNLTFTQPEGRNIFVFVIEGELKLNGDTTLQKRDSARINEVTNLDIQASADTRFMLIDLPA